MRQASRYQLVHLAYVSNPSLPKCKPSIWLGNLTTPVAPSNVHGAMLCQPAENLTQLRGTPASSPSPEAPPSTSAAFIIHLLIFSTTQNEGRTVVKSLERAQGTHYFREGCQLAKRKENNRKAAQQGWRSSKDQNNTGLQYSHWAEWIRGIFFPTLHKVLNFHWNRKIFTKELFQQLETEITWEKMSGRRGNSWGMVVSMGKKYSTKENTFLQN